MKPKFPVWKTNVRIITVRVYCVGTANRLTRIYGLNGLDFY